MSEPLSCSEQSLAVGEPLAGTAVAGVDRWLVLAHQPAWGPKGVEDSGLPAAVVAYLERLTQEYPRARVQLVRRREPGEGTEVPLFLAETGEGSGALTRLTLASLDALPTLGLEGWLRGAELMPGEPVADSLFLVCVHGKRDRCCARLGLPVYRALSERAGERVLETTHLGGHRFAATLLVLPEGISFGRVDPAEADALIAATARGEIYDLDRVRGRTAYTREAQAAEVQLRCELGERRAGTLALLGQARDDAGTWRVRFRVLESGDEREIALVRELLPATSASCGATPKPGERLVPLSASARG